MSEVPLIIIATHLHVQVLYNVGLCPTPVAVVIQVVGMHILE